MTPPAANDSADDIAAGFETLRRWHRRRLWDCHRTVRRIVATEGAVIVLCAVLGIVAAVVAGRRSEPLHSIMVACAMLNAVTILLCLRTGFRAVRDVLEVAREERAALRAIEADAARFAVEQKTLPAELTLSV